MLEGPAIVHLEAACMWKRPQNNGSNMVVNHLAELDIHHQLVEEVL